MADHLKVLVVKTPVVASTTILPLITLAVVVYPLNMYYPEVFKMNEAFHAMHAPSSSR